MKIGGAHADQFRDAHAGRVEKLDHRAIPLSERRRRIGRRDQLVDFFQGQKLRERWPRTRRTQIVGGTAFEPAVQHEEPVEPANRGDASRHRSWREAAPHLLTHKRLQGGAVQALGLGLASGCELRERSEVASVAFERVVGQPPLHTQMIQIRVNHKW